MEKSSNYPFSKSKLNFNSKIEERNPLRNYIDYIPLSEKHPQLKKHLIWISKKKATIDYKNAESLIVLNQCLLQEFFGIKWDLPLDETSENFLVPTLTSRVNYLLIAEEELKAKWILNDPIQCVDIGTGANLIYPLLGAVFLKWQVTGTEISEESVRHGHKLIEINSLQKEISIRHVKEGTMFKENFDKETEKFDLVVCNPPFFESISEKEELAKENYTGRAHELVFPGGEVAFVSQMIKESEEFKDTFKLFSSLLGKKKSLLSLKMLLKETKGVETFWVREIYQGKTVRWLLFWTFSKGRK